MSKITVSELNIYPVKSMAGVSLPSARVDSLGLNHDRCWMVVNEQARFITQRTHPRLALIHVELQDDGLILRTEGKADLRVDLTAMGEKMKVSVWEDVVEASAADPDAHWWLSEVLGEPCKLVRFSQDQVRQVDLDYARVGDRTAFSDGFPILLISQASLDDLNARLTDPLPMKRFRPNLVVDGTRPYEEDQWRRIRIAGVEFRIVKPCSRCIVTTIDPATGEQTGVEPLETLATYRKQGGKVMFGQNVIPDGRGILQLGDEVTILETT